MICPACNYDMIVVEQNSIELDYCTNCHGVWFDVGELELFLTSLNLGSDHDFLNKITGLPEVMSDEKRRRCPICKSKMMKKNIGDHSQLLVDICQYGDGLWFDGGELRCMIKSLPGISPEIVDSQDQILGFIGDTLRDQA